MDLGTSGLRIASSALLPLIRKLLRKDEPVVVDQPVRLGVLLAFRGPGAAVRDSELRLLADELVRRAARAAGPHDVLPSDELTAVAHSLTGTLGTLGELEMDDLQAVRLGHRELARKLLRSAGRPTALSRDAELLHDRLLETACLHLLNHFTQRSPFVARTLVEQTRQLAHLIRRVDLLAERVADRSAEDTAFEERYARYVAEQHGRLTIFGLDLEEEWPLDDAYLSLRSTETAPAGPAHGADDGKVAAPGPPQRAELALRDWERVLIRGAAGSGKTTLVQWLAVTTAQGSPPDGLGSLLGRVPFVLPMRSLTRGGRELPTPGELLSAVRCPHTPPEGWAERVLLAGRGLLLLDGIDEVPEAERETARRWLLSLVRSFPSNLWLVTSRPSAVPAGWLSRHGFSDLSLAPMGRADIATFVERWHHAAGADPADADDLLETVRTRGDLARLATSPLMCGLLCALHRVRHAYLPRGRQAVYDAALRMLLEQRDQERRVRAGLILDTESQTVLLQKLAYWLIRNGRSEMEQTDAVELIDQLLPSMPQVAEQGDAPMVFRHLLVRSGLLREPAEGVVDFVHRTFQDYLGAREAVDGRDLPFLVGHAHLDLYEDVIRMAVAHGRPRERERLLTGLVERGDEEKPHRVRLHLLAMACLEHAIQLDPEVRREVMERASAYLPPRTAGEAESLAAVGPVVLELLPGPDGLGEEEQIAVVRTLAALGGDAPIPLLRRYARGATPAAQWHVAQAWPDVDVPLFAEQVLPDLPQDALARLSVPAQIPLARGREHLYVLKPLADRVAEICGPGTRTLNLIGPTDLSAVAQLPNLRSLSVQQSGVSDLSPLRVLPLNELRLFRCPRISELDHLHRLPLGRLHVDQVGQIPPEAFLAFAEVPDLEIGLREAREPMALLPPRCPATALILAPHCRELRGVENFPRLRRIILEDAGHEPATGVDDWRHVAAVPGLEYVSLSGAAVSLLVEAGLFFPGVRSAMVRQGAEVTLAAIARVFPRVERVSVDAADKLDLADLKELHSLRRLRLSNVAHLRGTGHPGHVDVSVKPPPRY
ncbi:NACHT domain-containing NTPase [Streptomyces sp. JJ38]|uniref:NACHT domain-containing protein n=1 Tax=Streptomyces sp. JJ38 TaxID=2738128 RepID=UPI001C574F57|nr:NACHT domain-containing protein [Streptomyces sp. JJ38]MBW1596484.1 NACHT domain-containing protein [Streptomyces sp. JJ38]